MTLIRYDREKLIAAITYFVKNTRNCGKTKLFKLLYLLDFEHFKQTGRSVTGLEYFAWKMGPVPPKLFEEFNKDLLEPDLQQYIKLTPKKTGDFDTLLVEPINDADLSFFSKREFSLLDQLSIEFKNATAKDMVENTHLPNLPWHKVFHDEKREYQLIPYEYAIGEENKALIQELARESMEIQDNYGIK